MDRVLDPGTLLVFGGTAIALVQWLRGRSVGAAWFLLAFLTLAVFTAGSLVVDTTPDTWLEEIPVRIGFGLLMLFPYLFLRFVATFGPLPPSVERVAGVLTALVVLGAVSLPISGDDEGEGSWLVIALMVWAGAFFVRWAVLLLAMAISLWRGSHNTSRIARKRIRMISAGATAFIVGLIVATAGGNGDSWIAVAGQSMTAGGAVLILVGYAPPRILRIYWREPEQSGIRRMIAGLLSVSTTEELMGGLLPEMARIVSARGAVAVDHAGNVLGRWQIDDASVGRLVAQLRRGTRSATAPVDGALCVEFPFGWITLWNSSFARFFGEDETELIKALGTIVDLALRRVRAIERERESVEHLREVNVRQKDFVAIAAHDLRSPMTVIAGFARTIVDRWDELHDADKIRYLSIISDNTESLATLVQDVLETARIESGDFSYRTEVFDIGETIGKTVSEMKMAAPDRIISVSIPSDLPMVVGDRERNWQIITNLVSNALKFSPPESPIEIEAQFDSSFASVIVRDHGIGIPPDEAHRVFTKFGRIPAPQGSEPVNGTGLGLFICKSMVEAQGGTISFDSAPNRGSSFSYSIPRAS